MNNNNLHDGEFHLEVNGVGHWCRVAGASNNTTPIVIIHGGPGGNNYVFERTIGKYLESCFTVLYYEQRGCGRSEQPKDDSYSIELLIDDLFQLCKGLKLNRIIPLGYSFGGELAMEFTLAYPQLVEKLILQAPSLFNETKRSAFIQNYGFLQIVSGELKTNIRDLINSEKTQVEVNNDIWNIVDTGTVDKLLFYNQQYAQLNRQLWEESGLINTGKMYESIKKRNSGTYLIDKLDMISTDTLIIVGLHDRNVGIDLCRDIASHIDKSELLIFENSAHFPDIEETERYFREVSRFLSVHVR